MVQYNTCFENCRRSVCGKGLWHEVIKANYLKGMLVTRWIRLDQHHSKGVSFFWNGFLKILPWFNQKTAEKIGNGAILCIRIDPFVGCKGNFVLSDNILVALVGLGLDSLN